MRRIAFLITFFCFQAVSLLAQKDSIQVAEKLTELMKVCQKIDFADPNIMKLGVYYKAAPFFVYKGADEKRNLKAVIDYSKKEEKAYVDQHCKALNALLSHNNECVFGAFLIEEKMDGKTYSIELHYRNSQYEGFELKKFSFINVGGNMYLVNISE